MRRSGQLLIILVVVIIAIIIISKNTGYIEINNSERIKKVEQSLLNADRSFYKVSTQKGLGRAFIDFADDSVIIIRNNEYPIRNKAALAKHYLNHENEIKPLYWDPIKSICSPDGKLGYTFGKWEYTSKDKTGKEIKEYGNYLTIWKRQKDGSWKYVYDGGGSTPGPVTN